MVIGVAINCMLLSETLIYIWLQRIILVILYIFLTFHKSHKKTKNNKFILLTHSAREA